MTRAGMLMERMRGFGIFTLAISERVPPVGDGLGSDSFDDLGYLTDTGRQEHESQEPEQHECEQGAAEQGYRQDAQPAIPGPRDLFIGRGNGPRGERSRCAPDPPD